MNFPSTTLYRLVLGKFNIHFFGRPELPKHNLSKWAQLRTPMGQRAHGNIKFVEQLLSSHALRATTKYPDFNATNYLIVYLQIWSRLIVNKSERSFNQCLWVNHILCSFRSFRAELNFSLLRDSNFGGLSRSSASRLDAANKASVGKPNIDYRIYPCITSYGIMPRYGF